MSLLQAYLQKPSTQRVLSRKPGEKGFSLIELVVVVAVLAILAAIAIPAFTSISGKARASAAANTVATVAKECAAKIADKGVGANSQFNPPTLDGYTSFNVGNTAVTTATNCPNSGTISAVSSDTAEYPTFIYNVGTGEKTCTANAGSNAADRGCASGTW